jgi:flagellar basal body-associated protein FliL
MKNKKKMMLIIILILILLAVGTIVYFIFNNSTFFGFDFSGGTMDFSSFGDNANTFKDVKLNPFDNSTK